MACSIRQIVAAKMKLGSIEGTLGQPREQNYCHEFFAVRFLNIKANFAPVLINNEFAGFSGAILVHTFSMLAYYMLKYSSKCAPVGTTSAHLWLFQQTMMIEACLRFLNTSPMADRPFSFGEWSSFHLAT